MALPDRTPENVLEDIQSVNLQNLIDKYIVPVEKLRSMSAPTIFNRSVVRDADLAVPRELDTAQVDVTNAQESRAHAFYRMLGLPVIAANRTDFYNPGFNPSKDRREATDQANVASNIDPVVTGLQARREQDAKNRYNVFQRLGVEASVHALVLPIIKKFQVLDKNLEFDSMDEQSFNIPVRKLYIQSNFTRSDGEDLTIFKDSGTHILRPFMVNPSIENTVMPADRIICAPFLRTKEDTRLEENTFLLRPGIEQILRLRLKAFENTGIIEQTIFQLDPTGEPDIDEDAPNVAELRLITRALLTENKINNDAVDAIIASDIEVLNLNKLIQTIKGVVELLVKEIETINEVSRKINWTPLPDERGPEFGTDVAMLLKRNRTTKLEKKIRELQVKNISSSFQVDKADTDIGSFAMSFMENTEKTFNSDINEAKQEKEELIRRGSRALANIEAITGEISGLGLIDILAIYTALWAINLDSLVNMLDSSAFNRLYENNPELRAPAVQDRRNNTNLQTIEDVMLTFEAQVISILSFADKLFEQKLGSPIAEEGGDPTDKG